MGHLVQVGGGLVLSVASLGEGRQILEVKRAVSHDALARESPGQDALFATVLDIGAVVL